MGVIGRGVRVVLFGLLVVGLLVTGATAFAASSPTQDLQRANAVVGEALVAAHAGDLTTARAEYDEYESTWFDIEDGVRGASRDAYVAIEKAMTNVSLAFAAKPPDQAQVVAALQALDAEQQHFIKANSQSSSASVPPAAPTGASVQTLLDQLSDAHAALAKSDYTTATARLQAFESTWLDVEGQVKTRSADDYRDTENDMALATSLAKQQSPQAAGVITRMQTRLEPYRQAQQYGVFDAAIILLREGLEALLVIAALSAVLRRSTARMGQAWLWTGALLGLALSVMLGLAIQAFFGAIVTPANRELMEGAIGLVAAAMLVYVSYWLHSKASIGGWQKYISVQTRDALNGGRLVGIGVLAFLAVFREGAETALFYLGMVSNISNADLLLGLGIGFVGLVALGVLTVLVGVRIPMRPFFTVASVLVFYLCFKFVGTGIHALQVAGYVPSGSSSVLPSVDAIGVYPTWPTTLAQLILVGAAAWVLLRDRLSRPVRVMGGLGAGVLVIVGMACTGAVPNVATPTAAPAPQVQASIAAAPSITSGRREALLVAGPRTRLAEAFAAVQRADVPGARAAMEAYDAEWNGIEVYINVRSRDLYGEIETHYQAGVNKGLNEAAPDRATLQSLLQGMVGKYDEAIHLSDTGQPLSPLFDDLAVMRMVRAPLRTVSPALKAGDTAKASKAFVEFKGRWPQAQPLFGSRAPEALQPTLDALANADKAMASPTAESATAVDALLTAYNAGVSALNTAARDAGYAQ